MWLSGRRALQDEATADEVSGCKPAGSLESFEKASVAGAEQGGKWGQSDGQGLDSGPRWGVRLYATGCEAFGGWVLNMGGAYA